MKRRLNYRDVIELLEERLRDAGIEIRILGCGCCDSPVLTIRLSGKVVRIGSAFVDTLGDCQSPDVDLEDEDTTVEVINGW